MSAKVTIKERRRCPVCGRPHDAAVHSDFREAALESVRATLRAVQRERRGEPSGHEQMLAMYFAGHARILWARRARR